MKMDASESNKAQASSRDISLSSFFLQVQNRRLRSMTANQNNTVIKFTKLPEYDFDSQVIWPRRNSYLLQPHLRRIVTLNDEDDFISTSRSLRNELPTPHKLMSSAFSRRKIVTISEEDDNKNSSPLITSRKALSCKSESGKAALTPSQKSGRTDLKLSTSKNTSQSSVPSRYVNKIDTKLNAKSVALSSNKINNESKNIKNPKYSSPTVKTQIQTPNRDTKVQAQENKNRYNKEKEKPPTCKRSCLSNKTSSNISKTSMNSNLSIQAVKSDFSPRRTNLSPSKPNLMTKNRTSVIKVPLEKRAKQGQIIETHVTHFKIQPITNSISQVDCHTDIDKDIFFTSSCVGTDQEPVKTDVNTETDDEPVQKSLKDSINVSVQTINYLKSHFDSLEIPNVTLLKDKSDESKEDLVKPCRSPSPKPEPEPHLQEPAKDGTPYEEDNKTSRNKSYVIGCGSVTYTTKQKIDFQVVSKNEEAVSSTSSSLLAYPMNVVTVFKKENDKKEVRQTQPNCTQKKKDGVDSEQPRQSRNCSYDENNKLVKPSELISTIRLNNGLLQSDYICEQFQRELNFIDSFFESLQYLENCSLSNKSFTDTSVEHWVSKSGFDVNVIGPEYDSLFSKFENGTNVDDTETMASKSLCLLNLLIRDEQRRAKNLLFVLKMREDALKDFTKSQILWLENKKKHDNIDIPTLKKKQRGALLKLQHECGEMQRMRKALLALSEKRKVALIKTKKNIELKLKNNVAVEQMLLGKKKVKRNSISDRPTVPLKCFDLSSSGCDDSTTSRAKSEPALLISNVESVPAPAFVTIKSAEKSIQTGESLLSATQVDESTDTTTELFVTVDGGYLNILFNNFALPEIFSNGKTYEVNQEALKSIVNSANNQHLTSESNIVEKFIDQIKHRDQDRSTTPSTARSLVEEFDQYYRGFAEDEQLSAESPDRSTIKEASIRLAEVATEPKVKFEEPESLHSISTTTNDCKNSEIQVVSEELNSSTLANETRSITTSTTVMSNKEPIAVATQTGPLPVPVGAAAAIDTSPGPDIPATSPQKSSSASLESVSSVPSYVDSPLVSSLVSPVQNEAEELRRQQLAIEREIKALEQQQCQLLVVREIPDKPPPPYIPPAEPRPPKPTRMFIADNNIEEKVEKNLSSDRNSDIEPTDAFDLFLHDFCQEAADKHKKDQSDKPWDACNLLPQKPPLCQKNVVQKTAAELKEVLKGVSPCLVSNVSTRRSDHIDDILFAEWRRYEADWTALHTDEAVVKGQVFESIFQTILAKTVEEYKKIIQRDCHVTDSD